MARYDIIDGVGIIPAGETKIESDAFKGRKDLKSVIIPDSVTVIGSGAFNGCSGLPSDALPKR